MPTTYRVLADDNVRAEPAPQAGHPLTDDVGALLGDEWALAVWALARGGAAPQAVLMARPQPQARVAVLVTADVAHEAAGIVAGAKAAARVAVGVTPVARVLAGAIVTTEADDWRPGALARGVALPVASVVARAWPRARVVVTVTSTLAPPPARARATSRPMARVVVGAAPAARVWATVTVTTELERRSRRSGVPA